MTEVVFEYPNEAGARERLTVMAGLPRAIARVDRTCVGVVLEPVDPIAAQELLADPFCGPVAVTFDPSSFSDGPITLSQGIWWAVAGAIFGAVVVMFRRATKKQDKPRHRTIPLDR